MTTKATRGKFLIGTSGWIYKDWQGRFYPPDLAANNYLPYYASRFPTVEINYSFYKLPSEENFVAWREATPRDFVFAVKASRYLTHMKKLREPREPIARLFSRAEHLGDKLGPILFQFPPRWRENLSRLSDFLSLLPSTHRYACEFRDASWLNDKVYETLANHGVALVQSDYRGLPLALQVTADFTYIRLHGGQYGPGYSETELRPWAERITDYLTRNTDVYAYFNNDPGANAPKDAATLSSLIGID